VNFMNCGLLSVHCEAPWDAPWCSSRRKSTKALSSGCSWGNRSCRPLDQAHAKSILKIPNHFTHARRRQSELLGCLGKAFELNHRHKGSGFGETCSMH
jgi:hypothetical protein